jgi:peptidoglycan/xylan/chitin deacetylase (PgdA/CDA1 family)
MCLSRHSLDGQVSVGASAAEILVLAYHRIGDPPPGEWNDWFYVSEEAFAEHLRLLDKDGWTFIDLPRLLAGMDASATVPPRSVLITFDDADVTLLIGGLPRLVCQHVPAVVFVPTDFVGATNEFDMGEQPPERICSWDELRELAKHGVSIQAHSASHRSFAQLGRSEAYGELRRSKHVLEDGLRRPVEAFAYPFGDMGRDPPSTEEMLAELGYRAAFLYGGSCPWQLARSQRFRLARLAVGRDTDLGTELAIAVGRTA